MGDITQRLAETVLGTSYNRLPQATIHKAKQIILDAIGCALAGYITDRGRIALELVEQLGSYPRASIIGYHGSSWTLSAYANGELMNALDYCPLGPHTGHVVPYVFPACLSMAEKVGASGKDFIVSLCTAVEVGGRITNSIPGYKLKDNSPPYFKRNPRFSFTPTTFGAVAGAGKILGLTATQMANAFGIAGANMPVPAGQKWQETSGPLKMIKHGCNAGWVTQLGATAALLSQMGFTGDDTFFDSKWGFPVIIGAPSYDADKILNGLGETWAIEDVVIKFFPCCGVNHTGLQAIEKIMSENNLKPSDIEKISVMSDAHMLTPSRLGDNIESFADTQFSNKYIFGLAPFYVTKPSPRWQLPETYNDPQIREMMKKVEVALHPRAGEIVSKLLNAGLWPNFRDSLVQITANGKTYSAEENVIKGSRGNPLSDEEVKSKFRQNATYGPLRTGKTEKIIEVVDRLEEVDNILTLTELISK